MSTNTDYLVFRLYGPMASWGEPAPGGERPSSLVPTRSAVLGLIAAALGIERHDKPRLTELASSLLLGFKVISPGRYLQDFHTAQVPSVNKKRPFLTRKEELGLGPVNTVLSRRDYRCDGQWIVAVWLNPAATASRTLTDIAEHLKKPRFQLYLGRKSCPLAAPLQPVLVNENHVRAALDTPFADIAPAKHQVSVPANNTHSYYWQGDINHAGLTVAQRRQVRTERVWDEPVDPTARLFESRVQHVWTQQHTAKKHADPEQQGESS